MADPQPEPVEGVQGERRRSQLTQGFEGNRRPLPQRSTLLSLPLSDSTAAKVALVTPTIWS
jgi:hypothetical protein